MHQYVVLGLEYQHKVESTRDSQRHTIGEGTLSNGVVEEYSSSGGDGSREGSEDPRTHTQAVAKLPLTAHVGSDTDEEVQDGKLVFAACRKKRV